MPYELKGRNVLVTGGSRYVLSSFLSLSSGRWSAAAIVTLRGIQHLPLPPPQSGLINPKLDAHSSATNSPKKARASSSATCPAPPPSSEIAKTIEKEYGVKAFVVQGDMGLEADCVRVVEESIAKLGGLDVIVSNAGWTRFSSIPDLHATTALDWDTCYAVNVKAQNYLLRTALPTFKANPEGGSFIMTPSVAVDEGVCGESGAE
ncbi:hypothetical protein VE04_04089, partial [Pseudogymnoascus sp. 24MN13]